MSKIYAGSDHAGFALRRRLVEHLRARGHEVEDLGATTDAPSDYPDYAAAVGRAVVGEAGARGGQPGAVGLLVCGTGLGVCIAANKIHGVRAIDAWNVEVAKISRHHNDANVLCLGARTTPDPLAVEIADAWLAAPFEGGGRHTVRVGKIAAIEQEEDRADSLRQQERDRSNGR